MRPLDRAPNANMPLLPTQPYLVYFFLSVVCSAKSVLVDATDSPNPCVACISAVIVTATLSRTSPVISLQKVSIFRINANMLLAQHGRDSMPLGQAVKFLHAAKFDVDRAGEIFKNYEVSSVIGLALSLVCLKPM